MAKKDKAKNSKRERRERRFLPRSTSKPGNVKILGGLGAALLGVGAWAQFGRALMSIDQPPYPIAPYVLASGALLFGAAVWMGTSSEPAVRVGSAGLAIEKGDLRRLPWFGIERITWDNDRESLVIKGDDEGERPITISLSAHVHPQACAWFLKEARDRIPKLVDVPDEPRGVPKPSTAEGQVITLDPVQVVGKRCIESKELILYEPDSRVCPKCERIYNKKHVPEECACGASLHATVASAPTVPAASSTPDEA